MLMKRKIFGFGTIALTLSSLAFASDITFDRYHTQDEINQYMAIEAQKHPGLVTKVQLGTSAQGREISYVIIAKGNPENMNTLYFNGTHHGDEWSSTESILGLIDYLIENADTPKISSLLKSYAIYIQPLVNPDGHQVQTREDSSGNDLNRDYSYPGRDDGDSFKQVETQLVKKLVDQIKPRAAGAYHSGIEEVLWPWCFTPNQAPSSAVLSSVGKTTAQAMGMDRYLQSYNDYETEGEFIDYAYIKYKTIALTYEVSEVKTPAESELQGIVDRSIKGAIAQIDAVEMADIGILNLDTENATHQPHYGHYGILRGPRFE